MQDVTTAILLAAGESRRMGQCKQLLPLAERSALARCLETLLAAGIADVVVVVGPRGAAVATEARRYPVRVAHNLASDSDMAASLRVGLAALAATTTHVVVALCDQPLVAPATVATLLAAQRRQPERIVQPVCGGRKGHPLLLPRALLEQLAHYATLRDLLRAHAEALLPVAVADEAILLDMDTPADYARLLRRCAVD